jgi:membrane protease YdiL (CAAX protease family)
MAPPLVLWAVIVALLAFLVIRTVRKDRREYQRFKRYRTTLRRQRMFRKWLVESFVTFGGLSAVVLVLAWQHVGGLLDAVNAWPSVIGARMWLAANPGVAIGAPIVLALGLVLLTVLAIRETRKSGDGLQSVGDIQSMLPRNRQELLLTGVMSVNAGLVEELLFRLALPALVFGATGNAVAALVAPLLLFGAMHLYQGVAGVVGTALVGGLMMALYVGTGSIVWPIIVHALFDLRTLVLLPVAVFGVHRIDGRKHPVIPRVPRAKPESPSVEPPPVEAPLVAGPDGAAPTP